MTTALERSAVRHAWLALTSRDGPTPSQVGPIEVSGRRGELPSRFAVEELAVATVGVALLAAAELASHRGQRVDAVRLDRRHVADAVRSERRFFVSGRPAGASFAPLSRFWPTADGWVRTHANYPWHRQALMEALETSEDVDAVAAMIRGLPAEEVERRAFAAGGIATAVRTLEAWQAHPQGQALAAEPLIGHRTIGDSPPRRRAVADMPMADVRVLDLTRVIAGPVCTRFLAALGADVLRLDPPGRPDMPAGAVADSLLGKRSALVDFDAPDGIGALHELLAEADVVVSGYRPGALDRYGLGHDALTERYPGIVAVYLDAWGHSGPWSGRRGFDSVVQGPTGIAMGEASTGDEPGVLPCQILDHGTGYLAAAAVLDGLRRQGTEGGSHGRSLSLARTAMWLTSLGLRPDPEGDFPTDADPPEWLVGLDSAQGPVTVVSPPGVLGDRPLRWPFALTAYGSDPATWSADLTS